MKTTIDSLRALGGDDVVSVGGAVNQELEQVMIDVSTSAAHINQSSQATD